MSPFSPSLVLGQHLRSVWGYQHHHPLSGCIPEPTPDGWSSKPMKNLSKMGQRWGPPAWEEQQGTPCLSYHTDTSRVIRAAHPLQWGHADGCPPERLPSAQKGEQKCS